MGPVPVALTLQQNTKLRAVSAAKQFVYCDSLAGLSVCLGKPDRGRKGSCPHHLRTYVLELVRGLKASVVES